VRQQASVILRRCIRTSTPTSNPALLAAAVVIIALDGLNVLIRIPSLQEKRVSFRVKDECDGPSRKTQFAMRAEPQLLGTGSLITGVTDTESRVWMVMLRKARKRWLKRCQGGSKVDGMFQAVMSALEKGRSRWESAAACPSRLSKYSITCWPWSRSVTLLPFSLNDSHST